MAGVNNNGSHSANGITAIFIATGQDAANVAESSAALVYTEKRDNGDYYYSITIPSLIVATYGGGTGLPTQRECLELMDCYGEGKVRKFAEIVGATVLCGELSLGSAIVAEEWVDAHDLLGRNRPASENTQLRSATKRVIVAAVLEATSTANSMPRAGSGDTACSTASAPLVSPSVIANTTSPSTWWRSSRSRPRTRKLNRRLAAVLPTAVAASASALAHAGPRARAAPGTAARRPACEHTPTPRKRTAGGARSQACDALQVVQRRAQDIHARVGVVGPVDRHLVDAQAPALGGDQQFGVEEPALVADLGQQPGQRRRPHGLEAALGVAEVGPQGGVAAGGCSCAR